MVNLVGLLPPRVNVPLLALSIVGECRNGGEKKLPLAQVDEGKLLLIELLEGREDSGLEVVFGTDECSNVGEDVVDCESREGGESVEGRGEGFEGSRADLDREETEGGSC